MAKKLKTFTYIKKGTDIELYSQFKVGDIIRLVNGGDYYIYGKDMADYFNCSLPSKDPNKKSLQMNWIVKKIAIHPHRDSLVMFIRCADTSFLISPCDSEDDIVNECFKLVRRKDENNDIFYVDKIVSVNE